MRFVTEQQDAWKGRECRQAELVDDAGSGIRVWGSFERKGRPRVSGTRGPGKRLIRLWLCVDRFELSADTVAAFAFGIVQRAVGAGDDGFRRVRRIVLGEPKAGGWRERSFTARRQTGYLMQDAFADLGGSSGRRAGQDHHELIASNAPAGVVAAQVGADARGHVP